MELNMGDFYADDRTLKAYHLGCPGFIGWARYSPGHGIGWAYHDPDRNRRNLRGDQPFRWWRGAEVIVPSDEFDGKWGIPAMVPAYCLRCGLGDVSTLDIRSAVARMDAKVDLRMRPTPELRWLNAKN